MSFTQEQFEHIKQSYASPSYFIETFIGELSPIEKMMLEDLNNKEPLRYIALDRNVSNKVTLMYTMWRALFVLDSTNVIMNESLFARTMLWVDLMTMLESLPDWIIEHLEIDTDDVHYVKINASGRIIIAPAHSNYLRGMSITTFVIQDLRNIRDADERRSLQEIANILTPMSKMMRTFITNYSSLSIC